MRRGGWAVKLRYFLCVLRLLWPNGSMIFWTRIARIYTNVPSGVRAPRLQDRIPFVNFVSSVVQLLASWPS